MFYFCVKIRNFHIWNDSAVVYSHMEEKFVLEGRRPENACENWDNDRVIFKVSKFNYLKKYSSCDFNHIIF